MNHLVWKPVFPIPVGGNTGKGSYRTNVIQEQNTGNSRYVELTIGRSAAGSLFLAASLRIVVRTVTP